MPEPYSLEEIADRMAIEQLYARYIHAGDSKDMQTLDELIFLPNTMLDWTSAGYIRCTWQEAKETDLFKGTMFPHMFHFSGCYVIDFNADRSHAYVKSKMLNPTGFNDSETGQPLMFQVHGGYDDELCIMLTKGYSALKQYAAITELI